MNRIRRYFHREKGSAALYFALVLTVLFGMASIAIDSSNAYLQRRVMQTAADSAALAGARALAKGEDVAVIDAAIDTLATANGSTDTEWEFTASGRGVNVSTHNDFDTYFARVLGVDEMSAGSDSTASYAPVVGMDRLVPLAINGCDCLEFESFPQPVGEDDFGEIVIGNYIIGNVQDVNIDYVLDLSGFDSAYSPTGANRPYYMFYDQGNNGVHVAYGDGTAHTVERVVNVNGDGFIVDLWFKDRISTPPGGSPHCEGGCPDTTNWYYYTTITGTLTGMPGTRYEGAIVDVTEGVRAAQVGSNAHLKSPSPYLGATAWLSLNVRQQPSTDAQLQSGNEQAVNSMILLDPDGSDTPPTATPTATATEEGAPTATNTPVPPTPTNTPTNTPVPPTPTNTPDPRPLVVSFTLVNADNDQDIATITDGYVINLTTLPSRNLNIRANTNPAQAGSVRFAYDGNSNYQTESWPPFALQGDNSGDYYGWTPELGDHTLSGTAYTQSGGSGQPGPSHTISFSVVDPTVGGSCAVNYTITNDWGSGFQAYVRIDNNTGTTWNGWTIEWRFNSNQRITNLWNGNVSQDRKDVTVTNVGWNANVRNNDSVSFGFNGSKNGNSNREPDEFIVNGIACDIASAALPLDDAVASVPMPGASSAMLQDPSVASLALPLSVAPVATLAAETMDRVAFETVSLSASPFSGLTVSAISAPSMAPLTFNAIDGERLAADTLAVQPAARAAAVDSLVSSSAAAAVVDYCPDNILLNGSFENINGSGTPYNWSGNAGTGNHGYVIPDGNKYGYSWGSSSSAMRQDVNVVPGGTYSMSFYSSSHIPGSQTVKLQYLKSNGGTTGSAVSHTISVDIDHPSHVFGGPYTLSLPAAPANAAKLRVSISANNVDWAKVDKLCLTGVEPGATATPTPVPPTPTNTPTGGGVCPAPIDFEIDAFGNALTRGQIIDEEWAANGVHITTNNPSSRPAMIFNSSSPTGGDSDLGSPNQNFGGPGQGNGGKAGFPGANGQALGNILIISEDGDQNDPDDNAGGGTIIFTFDNPVDIDQVSVLDVDDEEAGGVIKTYNDVVGLLQQTEAEILGLGDNSYQVVPIGATNARRMEISLPASGGIPHVTFCESAAPEVYDLGDKIWLDTNGNGIQDGGELGIAGVDLQLYVDGLPQVVASTTTDLSGTYRFENLPAGNYVVKLKSSNFNLLAPLFGLNASPVNVGDDATDSDFDSSSRQASATVPLNGGDNLTVDGGFAPAIIPTATSTATATSTPVPTNTPTNTPTPGVTLVPQACELYPIALSQDTVDGALVGASLGDIWNGVQAGNFGWLTWQGAPNVPTLANSLTPPGDANTYVNPNDSSDRLINIGDWVQGSPGVSNASSVRDALDTLMTMDIYVPVWDQATGTGNNSLYRIVNFARVRITDYRLPSQNRITANFLGFAPNCGGVNPTATPTNTPTQTPTPTITATPTTSVPNPTPTPSAGSCSLDDAAATMGRYSLIVLDDLSTNSDVENRAFVGGNITSSSSANFGINVSGVAASEPMLVVVGNIVGGSPIQLNAGSLRLGGSSNGRTINFNGGGSLIQDNAQSDGPITSMLQDASAQLAALTANNTAQLPSGQPGPARFNVTSVDENGAAIFEVNGSQLFSGAAQQIELNPGSASMVIINVTGSSINWTSGNMVGNFTNSSWRSRVIWNFPGASTINFNSYNMMGAVLAPYAHVTTAANIDGSVAVRALTTTSEIHQPTLTANLGAHCDEEPGDPNAEGRCKLVWLDWDGGLSSNGELEEYILDPNRSGVRRVGDTIAAGPEVENVRQITDALDQWLNQPMNVVLYDDGDQNNGYQVCGFAELTMTEYDFSSLPKWLAGEFNVNLVRGVTDENAKDYGLRDVHFDD